MTTNSYITRVLLSVLLSVVLMAAAPGMARAQTAQADVISAVAIRGMLEDLRRNGATITSVRLNPFAVNPIQAPPSLNGPAHPPARLTALRSALGAVVVTTYREGDDQRDADSRRRHPEVRSRSEAFLALSDVVDVTPGVATVTVTALYRVHPKDRFSDYLTVRYRVEQVNGVWVVTSSNKLGQS